MIQSEDDRVHGMRLRLWTFAINGPIVHAPRDIDRGKLLTRPPDLSVNPINSHQLAKQEDMAKETNFDYEIYLSCS
jgi:hypothetical protein